MKQLNDQAVIDATPATELDVLARTVAKYVKKGDAISNTLTPDKCHLLHMVLGIAGEAGELVDAIKRHTIYNKDLDKQNVFEELGDLLFYVEGLMCSLDMTWEGVISHNKSKLDERYNKGSYSDQQAIERADKNE
jgi:NTP pyrophosphatase (non-canonical NTP hydrolase)